MKSHSVFTPPQVDISYTDLSVTPAQVDPTHIQENRKLFSEKGIEAIRQHFEKNKIKFGKFHSPTTGQHFRVLELKDKKLYAIYQGIKKNKALGKGCYGTVKLVQELGSGEWYALKLSPKNHNNSTNNNEPPRNERYGAEIQHLKTMEKSIGQAIYRVGNKKRYLILMKLEKGLPLDKFLEQKPLPFPALLIIMYNMCLAVAACHAKGLWHGDIKPENFIIDPITYQIALIDFGLSLNKAEKDKYTGWGSPGLLAHEVHVQNPYRNKNLSEKSEIHALGMSFGMMIDAFVYSNQLGNRTFKEDVWYRIPNNDQLTKTTLNLLADAALRDDFLTCLRCMTHLNPHSRPTMDQIKNYLYTLHTKLNYSHAAAHVGMVDLAELLATDKALSQTFIEHLKEMDYVCFIANSDIKEDEAKRMHLQLTQLGITVQERIYYVDHPSPLILIKYAKEAIRENSSPLLQQYYYMTGKEKKLTDEQIAAIQTAGIRPISNEQVAADIKQNKTEASSPRPTSP